jgi:putative ABC transport system permease protein
MDVWFLSNFYTYVRVHPQADLSSFETQLATLGHDHAPADALSPGQTVTYFIQKVRDIHTKSHFHNEVEPSISPFMLLLSGLIGLFVLLIAVINFVNLSIARALRSAKEVGIRKAVGALRRQIIQQFFVSTGLMLLFSILAALALIYVSLPALNQVARLHLLPTDLIQGPFMLILAVLFVVMGLGSSTYPAFFLSAFQPSKTIKSGFKGTGSGAHIRQILVIGQFTF